MGTHSDDVGETKEVGPTECVEKGQIIFKGWHMVLLSKKSVLCMGLTLLNWYSTAKVYTFLFPPFPHCPTFHVSLFGYKLYEPIVYTVQGEGTGAGGKRCVDLQWDV